MSMFLFRHTEPDFMGRPLRHVRLYLHRVDGVLCATRQMDDCTVMIDTDREPGSDKGGQYCLMLGEFLHRTVGSEHVEADINRKRAAIVGERGKCSVSLIVAIDNFCCLCAYDICATAYANEQYRDLMNLTQQHCSEAA